MDEYLLVARSITQAQHMAAVLARGGLRAGVLRTPSALSESGCSHAVRVFTRDPAQLRVLLEAEEMPAQRIYIRTAAGYEEMSG